MATRGRGCQFANFFFKCQSMKFTISTVIDQTHLEMLIV